jgi:hypothetical protein
MYLTDDYIQNKYTLFTKATPRFHFQDKIIMNLVDQQQKIYLTPSTDSMLKVVTKESFGVNPKIELCSKDGLTCEAEG